MEKLTNIEEYRRVINFLCYGLNLLLQIFRLQILKHFQISLWIFYQFSWNFDRKPIKFFLEEGRISKRQICVLSQKHYESLSHPDKTVYCFLYMYLYTSVNI